MKIENSYNERKEKVANRDRERDLSDIRFVIKSPEGRRFFWRVMAEGGVFLDAFSSDTNSTYYNLGRQSISRRFINDLLEAKPEAYVQMQQERESEAKSRDNIEDLEQKQKSIIG